jgi:hypothetical protein
LASRNIHLARLEAAAGAQSAEDGSRRRTTHDEFPNLTEAAPLLATPRNPAEQYDASLALLLAGRARATQVAPASRVTLCSLP